MEEKIFPDDQILHLSSQRKLDEAETYVEYEVNIIVMMNLSFRYWRSW